MEGKLGDQQLVQQQSKARHGQGEQNSAHLGDPGLHWVSSLLVASDMGFALYRRFFVPANGSPVSLLSFPSPLLFVFVSVCLCVFGCSHMCMHT